MTTEGLPLKKVLQAANVLSGQTKPTNVSLRSSAGVKPELADVLAQRLASVESVIDILKDSQTSGPDWQTADESATKNATAHYALTLLQALQQHEKRDVEKRASAASTSKSAQQPAPPLFGMRDIKAIQILSSLVARWGLASLLNHGILPGEMQERPLQLQVIEQDDSEREQELLATADACCGLVMSPESPQIPGEVQAAVLPHLLLPTLASLLQLESNGKRASLSAASLLSSVNPSTAMAALLTLLSNKKGTKGGDVKPAWVNPAVSNLLSKQMTRPGGILGILNVMLGRSEQEIPFAQLEQIARLITTPPKDADSKAYLAAVFPRILGILRPPASGNAPPPAFIRALCFCISSLIRTSPQAVTEHLLPCFPLVGQDIESQIELLTVITANIDPSPTNLAFLLSPVVSKLFSMFFYSLESRGDPVLREAISNLITVYVRALSVDELVQGISQMVDEAPQYRWQRTDTGGIESAPSSQEESELDTQIRPNPDLVVDWLKSHDRSQLTSALLLHWLDQVNLLRNEPNQEGNLKLQKMIILRLQLILKIIEECGSDIVKEAHQTLRFVDTALEEQGQDKTHSAIGTRTTSASQQRPKTTKSSLSLGDLKIVNEADSDDQGSGEEEAEFPELEGIAPSEQMQVTALTLLLSVLEGHEDLTTGNTPILRSIDAKLSKLKNASTMTTSRLASDAQFVLSLRTASTASSASSKPGDKRLQASRETYQEALKLLQDPILPVRAQGLSMLRSLVDSKDALLQTESALVPAILDIFVHAVQDEDSFIYLSAIQGLSGMVDTFGKEISKRLAALYIGPDHASVGEGEKGRTELDARLRAGEAIVQVIQRAETALPVYVDVLVPPMLQVVRTPSLPVALRSSAITVLTTCAEASAISLLPFVNTLVDGMLDLLSLESRRSATTKPVDETPDPLEAAATHPSLRRSAIVLLGSLISDDEVVQGMGVRSFARMKAVLGYVKQTDEDTLVRHNAGQVLEDCEAL